MPKSLRTLQFLDDTTIGCRLRIGFGLVLLLYVAYGVFSIFQNQKLAGLIDDSYQHPLTVGQAVREANIGILKIHRAMLQVPRAENDEQLNALQRVVDENETMVRERLRTASERFLGCGSDVEKTQKLLEEWAPIRADVIRLRREGKVRESEEETAVKGAVHVAHIEKQIAAVTEYASTKAAEFLKNAEETRDHSYRITGILLILSFLSAAIVAWGITQSVRRPVLALSRAATEVSAGDLHQRVDYDSRSELGTLARIFNIMVEAIRTQTETIRRQNEENERLLFSILPQPIAGRLKSGEGTIADAFGEVTVLFADIVGFTQFSSTVPVEKLVNMLNELFSAFDAIALAEGVEKIKTIGDAYMAVCGMPSLRNDHTEVMIRQALGMMNAVDAFNAHRGTNLKLRIGINRGPVMAGVIGTHKFIYDLWGDTVNVASRMESTCAPGRIQITEEVYTYLRERSETEYTFETLGEIAVKGKGKMRAYLLETACALSVAC